MAASAQDDAEEVTKKAIGEVSDTMRSIAPVLSGATRDSITDEVTARGGVVTGISGPSTRQAVFAEWGTAKMSPRAFAGPALDRHSADYVEDIADEAVSRW